MTSGFQNHLHLLYGLPGGWLDSSDILDRGAYAKRKKKREEELLEEEIAAQLLQARQKDIVIPAEISSIRLEQVLRQKMMDPPLPGELNGTARKQRIHLLMLMIAMDD